MIERLIQRDYLRNVVLATATSATSATRREFSKTTFHCFDPMSETAREWLEERAAILEFDANLPMYEAESRALELTQRRFWKDTNSS